MSYTRKTRRMDTIRLDDKANGSIEALHRDVWKEVAIHLDIEASLSGIAPTLLVNCGVDRTVVHDFDWRRGVVRSHTSEGGSSRVSETSMRGSGGDLRDWLAAGTPYRFSGQEPSTFPGELLLNREWGDWFLLPLPGMGADGAVSLRIAAGIPPGEPVPTILMDLREAFSTILRNHRLLADLNANTDEDPLGIAAGRLPDRDDPVETIIGEDRGLQAVLKRIGLVARSDLPVLILGETGSGKEVIARRIHERSARSTGPFLRVNCGAIPSELIDSELFGHTRGAFTGATTTRKGWFERADGGTLLLDEVGELPLLAQVRLLRVLQEGTFQPVGGESEVRVNVRIVAATHRDLPSMVREGRFREDLWYRIGGFPIVVPPLRERKEDIPALVDHFVRRAARRFGLRPLAVTGADLGRLLAYDWPGNIRELASVIDRAAILGAGETLEIEKALGVPGVSNPSAALGNATATSPAPGRPAMVGPLDDAIREHIELALAATRGRIEGSDGAAELLTINPHTLRARMRRMGIDWSRFRLDA